MLCNPSMMYFHMGHEEGSTESTPVVCPLFPRATRSSTYWKHRQFFHVIADGPTRPLSSTNECTSVRAPAGLSFSSGHEGEERDMYIYMYKEREREKSGRSVVFHIEAGTTRLVEPRCGPLFRQIGWKAAPLAARMSLTNHINDDSRRNVS